MLEQSVLICRDSNRFGDIAGMAERGGLLYRSVKLHCTDDKQINFGVTRFKFFFTVASSENYFWKNIKGCVTL